MSQSFNTDAVPFGKVFFAHRIHRCATTTSDLQAKGHRTMDAGLTKRPSFESVSTLSNDGEQTGAIAVMHAGRADQTELEAWAHHTFYGTHGAAHSAALYVPRTYRALVHALAAGACSALKHKFDQILRAVRESKRRRLT